MTAEPLVHRLDQDISNEILDPEIEVIRVPMPPSGYFAHTAAIVARKFHGEAVEWVGVATAVTRRVLRRQSGAVLLTRGFPVASNLVGYYCRNHAERWVAHFSDPFPPDEVRSHWYSGAARPLNYLWAARIVKEADAVTVTCRNAYRYMSEKLEMDFSAKMTVVTHLALPTLVSEQESSTYPGTFSLGHIGGLWETRRAGLLLQGLRLALLRVPGIRLIVYGAIDTTVVNLVEAKGLSGAVEVRQIDNMSPRLAQKYQRELSVNVAAEKDYHIPYSPMILSKYAHAVANGRPQLMLSCNDSAMADYTRSFGGGILVGDEDPENVASAILSLYEAWRSGSDVYNPPEALKKEFSPERIVPEMLRALEAS